MASPHPDPAINPLAFLQPVGLSPFEANAVMTVASQNNSTVQWQRPPPDSAPDVYVAHLRSVDLVEDGTNSTPPWSMDRYPPRVVVDERGRYQGRPVCLLGGCESTHLAWNSTDAEAIGELNTGLRFAAAQLSRQRIRYALGRAAWLNRDTWTHSRLHLVSHGQIVAIIDPAQWQVHLRRAATAIQVERVALQVLPARPLVPPPDFETLPMASALWELARRCNEEALPWLLPSRFLKSRLVRATPLPIPMVEFDEHSQMILGELDLAPLTAAQLRSKCKLPEPTLTRALAGLAVSRATRAASAGMSARRIFGHALGWLPGMRS
ncbi:MAG: hypothetical protein EPN79_07915 [Burkholderiaceae bacterium]|nr:hypothetical protein [Burkholderiales bacterium]TAL67768.1 MAG: hypothetical protein EPN79_07915 [Burkholderiaceae bacterium]TBR76548.1 MAG: hypothetical protein EPN64_07125 [Burkholderiaceae bacterium]